MTELRSSLKHLNKELQELHRVLMGLAFDEHCNPFGELPGPMEKFNLLTKDPRFQWLRTLSQTMASVDQALSPRAELDSAIAAGLLDHTRTVLSEESEFTDKLKGFLQTNPSAGLALGAVKRALVNVEHAAAN